MSLPEPATAGDELEMPPRRRRRIPTSLKTFFAVLVALCVLRTMLPVWNRWTIDRFLQNARDGDFLGCRAMLADNRGPEMELDEFALHLAAERPLFIEPTSSIDFLRGRQRFSVGLAAFNDHSLNVEWGRVRLGSAFWQFPPSCDFSLGRRPQALDESLLREQGVDVDSDASHE